MREVLLMEKGKGLESLLSIKKIWFMKENGNKTKETDLEDKFGLINLRFKDNGRMEGFNQEFLPGLMEVPIKENF